MLGTNKKPWMIQRGALYHEKNRIAHCLRRSKMCNPDKILSDHPFVRRTWHIGEKEVGQRVDRCIASVLGDISRTTVQQLIADGKILVNERVSKPGYILRAGDEVRILPDTAKSPTSRAKPRPIPLDIVYEDEDLLVVNKAAGMVVHPAPGHLDDTLVNALFARYPDIRRVDSELRPGIIHRLDKDTSGLIIVARNAATHSALADQMKRHVIVKRYLALVEGVVALDQGGIDAPIGRNQRNRKQMAVTIVRSR